VAKPTKRATRAQTGLNFNHAMVYSQDVGGPWASIAICWGLRWSKTWTMGGRKVYVQLRAAQGDGTLAIHMVEPGKALPAGDGIRLYFETKDLDSLCEQLQKSGVKFSQMPKAMPWGWKHAYPG
jgi:uncharacterized glyoxalase superfamily protein PhnB